MQILTKSVLIILAASILAACSSLRFPGVYRIPVQQGNYLETNMVAQLKPGLTKRQVRYIMGTPLIEDSFHQDRWDYYYSVKRGENQLRNNHFVVYFKNDKLTHWDGDYTPITEQVQKEQEEALENTKKKEAAKFK